MQKSLTPTTNSILLVCNSASGQSRIRVTEIRSGEGGRDGAGVAVRGNGAPHNLRVPQALERTQDLKTYSIGRVLDSRLGETYSR